MDYNRIRPDIIETLNRYVEFRCTTGGFLRAVLENNLMESFARADSDNLQTMDEICAYVYNEMPATCHGSPEAVQRWLSREV
jgi:hypothetical protein